MFENNILYIYLLIWVLIKKQMSLNHHIHNLPYYIKKKLI